MTPWGDNCEAKLARNGLFLAQEVLLILEVLMAGYDTVGGTALGVCKDDATGLFINMEVGSIGIVVVPLLVSLLTTTVSETLISADDDLDRDSFLKDKSGNAAVAAVVVGDNESVLVYSIVVDGVLGLLSLDKGSGGSAPIWLHVLANMASGLDLGSI